MLNMMVATAAAFLVGLAAASAAPFAGGPRPAGEAAVILAEQKQGGGTISRELHHGPVQEGLSLLHA